MKPLAESILASHHTTHRNNGVGLLYESAIRCSRLFKDVRLRILNTSVPLVHLAFSIDKILRMALPASPTKGGSGGAFCIFLPPLI